MRLIHKWLDNGYEEYAKDRGDYWHKRFCVAVAIAGYELGLLIGIIIIALATKK